MHDTLRISAGTIRVAVCEFIGTITPSSGQKNTQILLTIKKHTDLSCALKQLKDQAFICIFTNHPNNAENKALHCTK